MKICILTHTFPKYKNDTTAAFMHPFVLGLIKRGNDVVVVTPFHPKLRINEFPYRIFTYKYIWPNSLHRLGYSQTLSEGTRFKLETYILAPFLYLFGCIVLIRLLRRERFDIISCHWILPNGFIAYVASKIVGIAYAVTLAGSDVYVANKNIVFSKMARLAGEGASAICSDSPQYVKELKKTGIKIKNNYIIPYPVDTSRLKVSTSDVRELRRKLHIPLSSLVLLSVGRLVHKKGFRYLLLAFSEVLRKRSDVVLIIVGEGDLHRKLEEEAVSLGIDEHIKFVGNVDRNKIVAYYNLADLYVMASIRDDEGNIDDRPVALLEAIACGKPTISTNFPGNSLSIKHGKSGFLVSQKRPNELASSILELATSKALRDQMSKEALKIAREELSLIQVGRKYHSIFKNIVK